MAKLLAQWLELTLAEGVAIQAAAWARVNQIQSSKTALQKSFDAVREHFAGENPFAAEVRRLLSLEERNRALLAAQFQRAQSEQDSLDQSYRNLRKIQRSYVRQQPVTVWHCVS
jgi:hypothetical protein